MDFSYGELGSMILHQTLYNMFPPSSFDPQFIAPLAPQEFIQRILVPEAAVTLIMEDTGQDRVTAVQTMRESAGYGVAMFPDTSEGPEVGAGEDIVLERARARRRELEDEERIEALLFSGNSEDEHLNQTKGTKRSKMSNSATTTDIEEIATARRKMKRKKAGSRTDAESGPDGHAFRGAEPPPCISLFKSQPPYPWTSSPEPQEFTPKPKSTLSNPQRTLDGRSMSAPIDVDAPQFIDGADLPSVFEQQPPIQADRMAPIVQGSSDAQKLGTYGDLPNPRSKARERIVVRNSSVDRRLGQNEPVSWSIDQDQRRDSSVE
jgi:RTC4-like domain